MTQRVIEPTTSQDGHSTTRPQSWFGHSQISQCSLYYENITPAAASVVHNDLGVQVKHHHISNDYKQILCTEWYD